MRSPHADDSSEQHRWQTVQENIWRAEALAHILLEMAWGLEQNTPTTGEVQYAFARPEHLRMTLEILAKKLAAASDVISDLEPTL